MEEIEQKIDRYELAFHLRPELEEPERVQKWQEIEGLIAKDGGVVTSSQPLKRQRLSFPISHQRQAYFGVINFRLPAENIHPLKEKLQLHEQILRFLILNLPEEQKVLTRWHDRGVKGKIRTYTPPSESKKIKPTVKPEEMEKQIEEALENI